MTRKRTTILQRTFPREKFNDRRSRRIQKQVKELKFQESTFIKISKGSLHIICANEDDARVTASESTSQSVPATRGIRTLVLQQLCRQVSDEEIAFLAQVLNPDTQRRINEYRAEHEAKQLEVLPRKEKILTGHISPTPPGSVHTPVVSEFSPLTPGQTTIPITQIDDHSDPSTPPVEPHPTEPDIDNESEFSVPLPDRRQNVPPTGMDYLSPLECLSH